MGTSNNKASKTMNYVSLVENSYLMKKYEITFLVKKEHVMPYAIEGTSPSKILKIKNNLPKPVNIILIFNPDVFLDIETALPEFGTNKKRAETVLGRNKHLTINNNNNNSNSNSNSKQYIALSDLIKEQELKWFSNNNEGIMPKHAHNIDAKFDLRYLGKDAIKLELYLHTCINLKIVLEIPATTIVQLVSKSSLAKKEINIRKGIINAAYVGNIIAMLQNNSEKTYIIEPNKKIAQIIFLPLVKIAQLVLVRNRKKLRITVRKISGFRSMDRIDILVNMAEEKLLIREKLSPLTNQFLFHYMTTEAIICESEEIGLTNLYIPAKNYNYIKIFIYNKTENIIEIPKKTIIRYLTIEVENQPPNTILDFL
ncbi:hypothetical protein G9A89_014356 [Geosiphon pyriformis]|nr:hypothetical protein G9A89_014356 [Geosiphon pyriformis]